MSKPYVYITRQVPEQLVEPYREIANIGMWKHDDLPVDQETLEKEMAEADGIVTMLSDKVNEEILQKAKRLKVIANLAVGYDNLDLKVIENRGIVATNTPDVLTEATADLTFALLLATGRRLIEADQFVRQGKWKQWSPFLLAGSEMNQKNIGIVGMGRIGEAVARRAKGFGMEILYHNRTKKEEAEKELAAQFCSFEELLEKSDFVVCLTPLTDETKGLFNKDAFERMKQTAIFINVSRGAVVDEEALYDALVSGQIRAAGLDVFQQEPVDPNHPLLSLNQVVCLPHIGSASEETREAMIKLCLDNVTSVLQGKPPVTPIR
ncbi:D-glycerate dehydrogenase [Radiobacillus kanasensis]|uniref:2-hydroxyacid dehydrogenase n=1 Tax=Radiobacillus kanasensis TaxID=2844358 RepID=UPI001E657957|nr:D-glycerate dehydrogenase [Radiobacillus kanasensis]UFT98225.1 D-glycerate dehydrogenase [Radiobacillus kanasensis]